MDINSNVEYTTKGFAIKMLEKYSIPLPTAGEAWRESVAKIRLFLYTQEDNSKYKSRRNILIDPVNYFLYRGNIRLKMVSEKGFSLYSWVCDHYLDDFKTILDHLMTKWKMKQELALLVRKWIWLCYGHLECDVFKYDVCTAIRLKIATKSFILDMKQSLREKNAPKEVITALGYISECPVLHFSMARDNAKKKLYKKPYAEFCNKFTPDNNTKEFYEKCPKVVIDMLVRVTFKGESAPHSGSSPPVCDVSLGSRRQPQGVPRTLQHPVPLAPKRVLEVWQIPTNLIRSWRGLIVKHKIGQRLGYRLSSSPLTDADVINVACWIGDSLFDWNRGGLPDCDITAGAFEKSLTDIIIKKSKGQPSTSRVATSVGFGVFAKIMKRRCTTQIYQEEYRQYTDRFNIYTTTLLPRVNRRVIRPT